MSGPAVFVTGASGFIGRATLRAFRDAGSPVRGVDLKAGPDVVAGDTLHPAGWAHALRGVDVVVHTAAVVSNMAGPDEQWRVNVLATRRVVEAAAAHGVRRVVHLSSIRAFSDRGYPDGVTEAHPVRPDGNPYVDTKIASEHVLLQAHAAGEIEAVIIRPGDVYGPGSRPWVLTPLELMRSRQLGMAEFLLPAGGKGLFSPVYIDDLVQGIVLAVTRPEAAGQVFTMTGPRHVTTAEYFGRLAEGAGLPRPLTVPTPVGVALAIAGDTVNRLRRRRTEANPISVRYLARSGSYSIEKARAQLGYAPGVDLDEGMRRTVEWLRSQGLVDAAGVPPAVVTPPGPGSGPPLSRRS